VWLRELHTSIAVTTLLVTHDQEEAMEVADRLAIINEGRLEQVGSPSEIYDRPANEFVLKFLGPATQLDGAWIRPHDLMLHREGSRSGRRGTVTRVTHLGFEVRIDVQLSSGETTWVQLSRDAADELDLGETDVVWVAPSPRALDAAGEQRLCKASANGARPQAWNVL
jgi:sulfate transport system ATP-binding protein